MNGSNQAQLQHSQSFPFQKQFSLTTLNQQVTAQPQAIMGTCQDFQVDLYQRLNTMRASFKKRTLNQDVLGELALTEMLQAGVTNQSDNRFFQILSKYNVSYSGSDVDFMIYETHQVPKQSYQHSGDYSQEELRASFCKSLDDMMNGTFRMKLVQNYQNTHIAFAMQQTGAKMNVFRIAALATRKSLSIEAIIQSCTGIRATNGFLIVGRVLDQMVKPSILVLNRGQSNQVVVGPNRIGYNPEEGEFRIALPEEYQGGYMSQVLANSMFEIFVTSLEDQSFLYGQGQDMMPTFQNFSGEIGISDLIPEPSSPYYQTKVIQRNDSLLSIFNQRDLLLHSTIMQVNIGGPLKPSHTLGPNSQGFNVQPQFGRSMTTFQQTPKLQPFMNTLKPQMTMGNNNENINPNIQYPQTQSQMPVKFSLNAPGQQPVQASQFMRPQTLQTQPVGQSQNGPHIKFNFAQNTVAGATQVPPLVIQQPQPLKFNFTNQDSLQRSQTQAVSNQAPPLQPKITLKYGGGASKTQPPQVSLVPPQLTAPSTSDTSMLSNHISNNHSRTPVFSELSLIDQQTLQGYLKELQEDLTPEQLQRVTALMLTDPIKFYEYFQIAHNQLQISSKAGNNSKSQEAGGKAESKKDPPAPPSKTLSEFDDLTVFLLTIPQSLVDGREEQYEELLKQVKECKLTQRAVLKKLIIRSPFPVNESFAGMLNNARDTADMILELRQEEFPCHKMVMTSSSDYFKKALKENEYMNKYQYNVKGPYRQRLIVPEWIDPKAFKLFITYVYTGKVSCHGEGRNAQVDAQDILNLLKIGNFFYHQCLQEHLIADIIIPSMNSQNAVYYLKECFNSLEDSSMSQNHPTGPVFRKNCTYAWSFLYEYAQFYLQKHLPKLLKSSPNLAYELPGVLLRRVIDRSLLYVVDSSSKDMDTILQFTADTWTSEKLITTLFKKSQSTIDSCSAFDYQVIPQMGEFIRVVDPAQDYQCRLTRDQEGAMKPHIQAASPQGSPVDQKMDGQDPQKPDSTFFNAGTQSAKLIVDNDDFIDINSWKPSANIIKAVADTDQIFEKEPQYQTTINLDDPSVKESFQKNKGLTVFSKAFNFGRRSWMLKVDLDIEGNVSLFIVERGAPIDILPKNGEKVEPNLHMQLGLTVPIKFSSILTQFELVDPAFGDHKSQTFFSFAHDQHQVVGHDKLINLSQLQNKSQLKIKVMMKELIMHSALMWHIASNFQDLYAKDLKQIEVYKKNTWSGYTQSNQQYGRGEYEVLNLRFYTVFQLFQSHHLKVETENLVLGYLYHYTRILQSRQPTSSSLSFATDLLATTLRFQHLSTPKLLSALRDSPPLRHSKLFTTLVTHEFLTRAQLPQASLLLGRNNTGGVSDPLRHGYDESKYMTAQDGGRGRYTGGVREAGTTMAQGARFVEDLVEWLKNSKHSKKEETASAGVNNGEVYVRQEVMKLQALYYEERRRCQELQTQVARLERRNEELEKMLGMGDQWKYGVGTNNQQQPYRSLRRSLSSNDLQGQRRYNQAAYYSPPQTRREAGGYINNNDLINAANKARPGAAIAANHSSFDQSAFFSLKNSSLDPLFNNETYKHPLGGSTAKADRRLLVNQYADMSRLLNRLDRHSPKNGNNNNMRPGAPLISKNPQANERVPYYRAKQGGNNQDGECSIF